MKALLIEETEGKWIMCIPGPHMVNLPYEDWELPERYQNSRKVYTEDESIIKCVCPSQIVVDEEDNVSLDTDWSSNLMSAEYQTQKLYNKKQDNINAELALEAPDPIKLMRWQQELAQLKSLVENNLDTLSDCKEIFEMAIDQLLGDTVANAAKPLIRAQLQVKLGIPVNVEATEGDTEVELTWDEVADADSYKIYWGTETGVYTDDDTSATNSYTITELTNDTPYFMAVVAIKDAVESRKSDEQEATPVAA